MKSCLRNGTKPKFETTQITAEEISAAEIYWIKTVQARMFSEEIEFLRGSTRVYPIRVHQFGLFIDENQVVKCQGRIGNSTLSLATKKPILVPTRHPFVDLLINDTHERVKHGGIGVTLTTIRERYWLLKGRQSVKRVLRPCVVCKRLEGPPYTTGTPPDLPSIRVSDDPPLCPTRSSFESRCESLYLPLYMRVITSSTPGIDESLKRRLLSFGFSQVFEP